MMISSTIYGSRTPFHPRDTRNRWKAFLEKGETPSTSESQIFVGRCLASRVFSASAFVIRLIALTERPKRDIFMCGYFSPIGENRLPDLLEGLW